MGLELDLHQVVYVLSDALDLVGVDDVAHGKRVAYMAVRCAEALGLSRSARDDLLYAGLFHDCGVSSTREHRDLVASLDWDGEDGHCRRGEELVATFPPMAHLAPVIRWHHSHATSPLTAELPDPVRLAANLVYLADRVDVLATGAHRGDVLSASEGIRQVVRDNVGTRFRADAVEGFLVASRNAEFWLMQEPQALGPWLGAQARHGTPQEISPADLRALGRMFAAIVDGKSPFTAEHSHRVAAVAEPLAAAAGICAERRGQVEIAGLLHDIGKLRVPDAVLGKAGSLDESERLRITRHAFDTYQILHRIDGFEEIARWAAHHHEWVRGGGYPFGIGGAELSPEARIVAVADVFQALRQDRPYRARMSSERALGHIDQMARARNLDGDLVSLLHRDLETFERAATGAA